MAPKMPACWPSTPCARPEMSAMARPVLKEDRIHPAIRSKVAEYRQDIIREVQSAIASSDVVVVGMAMNPFPRKARKALLAKRVRRAKKERKGTRGIKAIPERETKETKETKGTGARKATKARRTRRMSRRPIKGLYLKRRWALRGQSGLLSAKFELKHVTFRAY